MSELQPFVEIKNLTKNFGKKNALDSVNLEIFPGRIIGLLGPNGCGKSTLIRHMIGFHIPTRGSCTTFGHNAAELDPRDLARIGYVLQEGELLNWMTVGQLIGYVKAYYSNWNMALEKSCLCDFDIRVKDRVGALSPGQRQKLAILLAICHEPDLLILDEPASALDPLARAHFLELLLKIIQIEKKTILITSHILTDVEKVIDHVIMMKDGRIVEDQALDDLCERYICVRLTSVADPLPERLPFEKALSCERDRYQAILTMETRYYELIKSQLNQFNYRIDCQYLPLEEVYRIIMGAT